MNGTGRSGGGADSPADGRTGSAADGRAGGRARNHGEPPGVLNSVRHDGSMFRVRAAGLLLTAAYLTVVGWTMLRPHYVAWVPAPNLRPLATIHQDLLMGPAEAARRIGAGLGLLAPLGVLLPLAGGRVDTSGFASFARTVFAGLMVSLSLEFTQTLVPGQLFDVDALLLNTLGVAAAHLLIVPRSRRLLRERAAGSASSPEPLPAALVP
jgi:glycopeptide antibiotics resistance protein